MQGEAYAVEILEAVLTYSRLNAENCYAAHKLAEYVFIGSRLGHNKYPAVQIHYFLAHRGRRNRAGQAAAVKVF